MTTKNDKTKTETDPLAGLDLARITPGGLTSLDGLGGALSAGAQLAGIVPRFTFIEDPDRPDAPGSKIPVALVAEEGDDGKITTRLDVLTDLRSAWDANAPGPRRRTGTTTLTEEKSFTEHVQRYASDATVIYADTTALGFTAVYDENPAGAAGGAGWRGHRAVYKCPRSAEWLKWTELDGKLVKQSAFAAFIESRYEDLTSGKARGQEQDPDAYEHPRPVDLIQMAKNLSIRTRGTFERSWDHAGNHVMVNKSETEPGSTVIPRAFLVAIPVFEGGERYQIEARVQFSIVENVPTFVFTLHRRAEIERDAFTEIRDRVATATGRLVLAGAP